MAITARIQNTRSAHRTGLRAARQERCASATRSSAAVSPVLMEDHPQLEALHHQGSHCRQQTGHKDPGPVDDVGLTEAALRSLYARKAFRELAGVDDERLGLHPLQASDLIRNPTIPNRTITLSEIGCTGNR